MSSQHRPAGTPNAAHELKQRVFTCLDRLSDRDTLAQATAELDLIARSLSPDTSLSPFLSCLLSVDSSHKAPVRSHSLRLIASLASSHGPHLSPHLPKILSSSLIRRLRDPDTAVRSACSDACSSLARHVTSSPFKAILDPLLGTLLVEQDYNVQIGSALCLSAAIDSSENVEAAELRRILPKILKLARADSFRAKPALLALIGSVVAPDGGGVVNGPGLMGSIVSCAAELLSSDDWAARKAAAEALEKVAVAVARRDLVVEVKTLCVNALEKRRFDKVKIAREAMNRALETWKAVNEVSMEDSPLSQSKSVTLKDKNNGICPSPVLSDHHSFGFETPEPKKGFSKSRSSLSDCSTVTGSPPPSKSSVDVSSETPQLKKTLSKSRSSVSSLSDDSTMAVAKKVSGKKSSPRHGRKSHARKPLDWKVDIRLPQAEDTASTINAGVGFEQSNSEAIDSEENSSGSIGSSSRRTFMNNLYEDRGHKSGARRFGNQAVPFQDLDDSGAEDVDGGVTEDVYENNADVEGISLIRQQLIQIERQQANLMELVQTFMGTSQSGINSLETRVSGLEKALNAISHNLAIQGGRISNESPGNSCCIIRGAEFLNPKFWRKNESGHFAAVKPCCSGSMHSVQYKEDSVDIGETEGISQSGSTRDSGSNSEANLSSRSTTKNTKEISQRRPCSGGSLNGASPRTCMTPMAQRI